MSCTRTEAIAQLVKLRVQWPYPSLDTVDWGLLSCMRKDDVKALVDEYLYPALDTVPGFRECYMKACEIYKMMDESSQSTPHRFPANSEGVDEAIHWLFEYSNETHKTDLNRESPMCLRLSAEIAMNTELDVIDKLHAFAHLFCDMEMLPKQLRELEDNMESCVRAMVAIGHGDCGLSLFPHSMMTGKYPIRIGLCDRDWKRLCSNCFISNNFLTDISSKHCTRQHMNYGHDDWAQYIII